MIPPVTNRIVGCAGGCSRSSSQAWQVHNVKVSTTCCVLMLLDDLSKQWMYEYAQAARRKLGKCATPWDVMISCAAGCAADGADDVVRSEATCSDGAKVVRCVATCSDGAKVVRSGATCSDGAKVVRSGATGSDGAQVVRSEATSSDGALCSNLLGWSESGAL